MKILVFLNEQHSLLPQQEQLLNDRFGRDNWEIYSIPATGWTRSEQEEKIHELVMADDQLSLVFASPVPYMIKLAQDQASWNLARRVFESPMPTSIEAVYVFHNDRREKKELPNGKVIFTVAKEGWEII